MRREERELKLPLAFSGPAQLLLYTRYGDPREPGWEHKWITQWHVSQLHPWFPADEIAIHKHFWPMLQDAFLELRHRGLHKEIRSFHESYAPSSLCHSPVLSVHSWGVAIDLNAAENPKGSMGKWSPAFIEVMTRHGVFCGQNWAGVHEPMHFSMVEG